MMWQPSTLTLDSFCFISVALWTSCPSSTCMQGCELVWRQNSKTPLPNLKARFPGIDSDDRTQLHHGKIQNMTPWSPGRTQCALTHRIKLHYRCCSKAVSLSPWESHPLKYKCRSQHSGCHGVAFWVLPWCNWVMPPESIPGSRACR